MTQPQPITLGVAADLLRKAVARRGEDTVVPGGSCYYVMKENEDVWGTDVTWKPSCLVGEVLVEHFGMEAVIGALGVDDYNNSGSNGTEFENIVADLGLPVDPDAAQVLNVAQEVQDGRYGDDTDPTWGNALKIALVE